MDPALADPIERSNRGAQINEQVRAWMARNSSDDIVKRAQQLGVPVAKYRPPGEVVEGEHERARGLFAPCTLESGKSADFLIAPYQFRCSPLSGGGRVPRLNEMAQEISL